MFNQRDVAMGPGRLVLCFSAAVLLACVLGTGTVSRAETNNQVAKGAEDSSKGRLGSIAGRITVHGKPASGLAVALKPYYYDKARPEF